MKLTLAVVCLGLMSGLVMDASAARVKDRTITKVVKMLQDMLEKSEKDGDGDREIYAKFKCYCDDQEAEKRQTIDDCKKKIAILESKIAEDLASSGVLSKEVANIRSPIGMIEIEAARAEATSIREKEHEEFLAFEKDMTGAIDQLNQAIETLSEIGADQTMSSGADQAQFMAGHKSLVNLRSEVHSALIAASSFLTQKQKVTVESFIQAPFTGTYTSQSGEIVGILKNMRDTFVANLASARAAEATALKAFEAFMAEKEQAYKELKEAFNMKQTNLGENDDSLAGLRMQLDEQSKLLAESEDFLAKLLVMCADKAKEYDTRKRIRANEDAAIAQAIAILNSDAAFETFGSVKATSEGGTGPTLLQLGAAHRHQGRNTRRQVLELLRGAAGKHRSLRLAKIAVLLEADNPFDTVLAEIEKVLAIIAKEGAADKENLDWCNEERETNHADLESKKEQITSLEEKIAGLDDTINNPETGLLAQIQETEDNLETNHNNQVSSTETRRKENLAYQANIANLAEAESLLKRATKVLKAHYQMYEKKAFAQEDPAENAPSTWEDEADSPSGITGQSEKGMDAIGMLEFILEETVKEETVAHETENQAQHDYEDEINSLKAEEAELQESLANLKETLAEKQAELAATQEEHAKTVSEKEAIEAYLLKIKAGCDFITKNFDDREKYRGHEEEALKQAIDLIKGTPAYKAAVVAQEHEDLGECKEICLAEGKAHVKCKACLAGVTVPGYCAGHEGTEGC